MRFTFFTTLSLAALYAESAKATRLTQTDDELDQLLAQIDTYSAYLEQLMQGTDQQLAELALESENESLSESESELDSFSEADSESE